MKDYLGIFQKIIFQRLKVNYLKQIFELSIKCGSNNSASNITCSLDSEELQHHWIGVQPICDFLCKLKTQQ